MDHVDLFFYQNGTGLQKIIHNSLSIPRTKASQEGCNHLKKYSKRIEMKTFLKILSFANEHGPTKRTNMATNTKMSYTRFKPILETMIVFGFLIMNMNGNQTIIITEAGKQVLERLQNIEVYAV